MEVLLEVILFLMACLSLYFIVSAILSYFNISHLVDKYIFITGCDSGFGRQTALKLDDMGCRVIAGCFTERGEEELRKSATGSLQTVHIDITSRKSIDAAFEKVKEVVPPKQGLWALVNNAGIAPPLGPAEWFSREDYRHVMEVNTLGGIDVTCTFLPLLKKSKGRIVFMTSMVSALAIPRYGVYSMCKRATDSFADSLRRELSIWGVTVHTVQPGAFLTTIHRDIGPSTQKQFNKLSPEIKKEYGEEYLKSMVETEKESHGKMADEVEPVVKAIIHAVLALFPNIRYTVGLDAKIVTSLAHLPDWVQDLMLRPFVHRSRPAKCRKR